MSLLNNSNAIPTTGGGYNLEDSLRFRSSASAYLSRTPTVAGNRKTWTWSSWVKRGDVSTATGRLLFAGTISTNDTAIYFANNTLSFYTRTSSSLLGYLVSTPLYRDPSSWYHIVVAYDSTQATASDRIKIYVNGEQLTSFSTETYPAINTDSHVNANGIVHNLGRGTNAAFYYDGYLTEVNLIDGQALTEDDFGETNSDTGVWQPKKYTGTYGTNGFYLPFNDASSVAALGFDNSGNSNNWTPNNISVYGGTSTSFSTVGTTSWTAPAGVTSIKYLVVAGGGGGGSATTGVNMGGGGGAGGLLQGTLAVTPGNSYTVTIGSGGAANTNGGDSVLGTITATGGGYGARNVVGSTAPSNGGSGGGASAYASNPGSGIAGQGFSGGTSAGSNTAAGGGGSSEVGGSVSGGTVGGKGGDGTNLSISGSSVTYAGGGGGGAYSGETGGAGGSGGGGAGGSNATDGANATGYGSGGGGAGQYGNTRIGGSGSSGIVVISYGNSSTYDSMTDVPTLTDEDTANYCVMNPLDTTGNTLSEANLKIVASASSSATRGTISVSSGKWYWEVTFNGGTNNAVMIGISDATVPITSSNWQSTDGWYYYGFNGNTYTSPSTYAYGASYTTNDVIGVALDSDAGTLTFYKNGVSQGVAFTGLTDKLLGPNIGAGGATQTVSLNFGQRPFAYTPPAGHLKLNTFNLPDSSIVDGSEHFVTALYTGTGSSRSIDNTITSSGGVETGDPIQFQPDLTWIKVRNSASYEQMWFDSVRGATKYLRSNNDAAEGTVANSLTSFDSNGFSLGANGDVNGSTFPIVAWNWKAGGTAVSNTAGTIGTSQVSANTTAGFSVGTYSGDGTNANKTVGHGLGVVPEMIIVKSRSEAARNWLIWHKDLNDNDKAFLFNTDAAADNRFGPNAPTTTVFGAYGGQGNRGTSTMVFYAFASVEGYSKFGSYTGNGSTDGPFVYTGFRPAFVMVKTYSTAGNWFITDAARDPDNVATQRLFANLSNAEDSSALIDLTSNGFKLRMSSALNDSANYIYMAFAENPFKNSLAR